MKIPGLLKNKEFVLTIQAVYDVADLIEGGVERELDVLRERGSAELIDIELRSKANVSKEGSSSGKLPSRHSH